MSFKLLISPALCFYTLSIQDQYSIKGWSGAACMDLSLTVQLSDVICFTRADRWVENTQHRGNARETPLTSAFHTDHWTRILSAPHAHSGTVLCSRAHTHTHTHTTHVYRLHTVQHAGLSISWPASVLMMLLTLMREGTHSWRQLTMPIMEISHRRPADRLSCQGGSHW